MFVDLDWPLNASSLLSASAELLVIYNTGCDGQPASHVAVAITLNAKALSLKTIFNMAFVRHTGFVMTSSYCMMHPKTAFYVLNFVLNFHDVRFRNFLNIFYFMFQHFGLTLPISDLILTILVKIGKMWKLNIVTPKGTSLAPEMRGYRFFLLSASYPYPWITIFTRVYPQLGVVAYKT